MANWLTRKSAALLGVGLALGLLVGVGMMTGTLCAVWFQHASPTGHPELVLHAESASGCDSMAVATGPIDEDSEGLFTLDFLTGELSCFVIYAKGPAARSIGGKFKANVTAPTLLGTPQAGKKPHYLLVTGKTNFVRGGSSTMRPGFSVAYVVDTNTGKWVAFGVPWNPSASARGQVQEAALIPLATDNARSAAIRPE
jgi:hypothetical protein